jgi:SAM-dependent methyltransferase
MLRFPKCPCCDGSSFFPVFLNKYLQPIESWRQFFYGNRSFISDIYECRICSFQFINKINARANEYYREQDCQVYAENKQFRQDYFRNIKKNLEVRLNLKLPTSSNILDIGCASGDWLVLWKETASLYGTELSTDFQEDIEKNGIQLVHPETIGLRKYDLISMFDYLEHVECPETEINRFYKILNRGGYLVIGVPDMGKWQAKLFGTRYYLYCPMHFSYFNRLSLQTLINKNFQQDSFSIFPSPPMKTNFQGISKWIGLKKISPYLSRINFSIGYSASLILVARK